MNLEVKPNVLLVILDGVRAKSTSLHGYERETTPFLQSFAEQATVYEQARSPGVESLSSHTSILTGYHVPEHNITSADRTLKEGELIWESLRLEDEYKTGVFTENPFLTKGTLAKEIAYDTIVNWQAEYPFPEGVDPKSFVENGSPNIYEYLKACIRNRHPIGSLFNGVALQSEASFPSLLPDRFRSKAAAKTYADAFLEWEAEQSGPWGACINLMDAHMPYSPNKEFNLWDDGSSLKLQSKIQNTLWEFNCGHRPLEQLHALNDLYDGAIRQMDAQIEYIVNRLANRGELENTLLVVTADHGEGFGERSRIRDDTPVVAHGAANIHEVVTHVPLVVKYPGQTAGERIKKPATLTRFPAVARATIAGEEAPSFVPEDGIVVSHVAGEQTPKIHDKIHDYCDDISPFTGTGRAVYEPNDDGSVTKYVTWGTESATIRIKDSQTATITAEDEDGKVDHVYEKLTDKDVRQADEDQIDDATREHLKDLGYA